MKNEKTIENENNKIVIILPETKQSSIKKFTIFLLGVSIALMTTAYINFNESLGLIAFGIISFLFIYDEGFRRIF